jgi:hypothetical protein
MEQWVANRTVRDAAGNEWLTSVGVPRKSPNHRREWACPFRIVREGRETVAFAHGIDEMQALELAFQALRMELEKTGATLTWFVTEDGVAEPAAVPGDVGLYRSIPSALGQEVYQRLVRLVDDEVAAITAEYKRRYEERKKP